jgi:hypothetical protein
VRVPRKRATRSQSCGFICVGTSMPQVMQTA